MFYIEEFVRLDFRYSRSTNKLRNILILLKKFEYRITRLYVLTRNNNESRFTRKDYFGLR